MGADWTSDFRACNSVEEYLLGECLDGACGHNALTWGNPAFLESIRESGAAEGETEGAAAAWVAPHEADGWELAELPDVSRWMLSKFASDTPDCVCHSAAVSFRRAAART